MWYSVIALDKDNLFLDSVRLTPTNGWTNTIVVEDDPNLGLKLNEEFEINGLVRLYRDYEMTYSGDMDNGYVITNTERPIKVTKKINGNLDTLEIAPEKNFTYNIKAELPYRVESYEMFEFFDVLDERVVLQEGKLPEILGEAKNFFEVTVDGQEIKARIKDFQAASEFVREALEGGKERVVELVIPVKLKAGVTSTVPNEVSLTYEHPTLCGYTMLTGRVTPPPVTVTPPGNPPGGSTLIPPPPTTDKPPVPTEPTPPPVVVPPEEIPVEPITEEPNKPKTPKKKGKVLPKTGLSESNALGLSLMVIALSGTVVLFRRKED